MKGSLQNSKKKALTNKVIIDGEIYYLLLNFLEKFYYLTIKRRKKKH